LRKYNFSEEIIDAAESHHFEREPKFITSWIVAAADAISAGRE
jgi:HD superfamily phosphodiesterase